MKRQWRYQMIDALPRESLPAGCTAYEIFKDEFMGHWGIAEFDRPLTGAEIDHYNLDGPLTFSWPLNNDNN
jgi:hypothetical protein